MDSENFDREALRASRTRFFRTAGRLRPPRLHDAQRDGRRRSSPLGGRANRRCSRRRRRRRRRLGRRRSIRTSNVVKKSKGPVMTLVDEFYKVGPGTVLVAHDRPDADHLRFLPARGQAAGRPAGAGDRAQGPSVRQPQRDRQGPRHRARGAGRPYRHTSRRRSIRPFLDELAADPDKVFPVKLGAKTINVSLEGHHLRRAQGRFPSPQHDDRQAAWPATRCCSSRNIIRSAAASSSGRAMTPPKKNPPKYPYSTMAEVLALHEARQHLARPARLCQRDWRFPAADEAEINAFLDKIIGAMRATVKTGLERADGDLARADQAQDQGRRRLQERDDRSRCRPGAASASFRPPRSPGRKKMRAATWSSPRPTGGSAGVMPAVIYSLGPDGAKKSDQKLREGAACRRRRRLSVQAQRDPVGGRRRLPGRDRRRLGDGRGGDRAGA